MKTAKYIITPNYDFGVFNAQVQLIRTTDDAILYSLPLTQDNIIFLAGYAKGKNFDYIIL